MTTTKKIPCETYSRVVGYFRPVNQWNKGKRAEFDERKPYKIPEGMTTDENIQV